MDFNNTTISNFCDEKYLDITTIIPDANYCQDFHYNYLADYYKKRESTPIVEALPIGSWEDGSQSELIQQIFEMKAQLFDISLTNSKKSTISSVPKFTKISSEIREMSTDTYFNEIFRNILSEIDFLLGKEDLIYQVNVKIEPDIEIPEWEEILFLIRIPRINHKELIRLWKKIGENVREKIELIEIDSEATKKKYENISIILEEFE